MRTTFRLITISGLLVALIGCSHLPQMPQTPSFKNRDKVYLSAQTYPPLRIPPGISSNTFNNKYPIPNRSYAEGKKVVSIVPPGLMD